MLGIGCGKKRPAPPREPQETTPTVPTSTKVENPTVRVADPNGKWAFQARAKSMTAASQEGPYAMSQAEGTYTATGHPPVHMKANRLDVDRGAPRAALTGAVTLSTPTAVARGEHFVYNLKTGKVQAVGPTKWTFAGKQMAGGPPSGGGSGKR